MKQDSREKLLVDELIVLEHDTDLTHKSHRVGNLCSRIDFTYETTLNLGPLSWNCMLSNWFCIWNETNLTLHATVLTLRDVYVALPLLTKHCHGTAFPTLLMQNLYQTLVWHSFPSFFDAKSSPNTGMAQLSQLFDDFFHNCFQPGKSNFFSA